MGVIKLAFLLATALTRTANAAPTPCETYGPCAETACNMFATRFPNQTVFPGTAEYDFETKTRKLSAWEHKQV